MKDTFGRDITYLRMSVTDLCNLRCVYCMPESGVEKKSHGDILTVEELEAVVRAAVSCGISKVRLTGGEPLVRKGIVEICRRIGSIPGVDELCMTTNGVLLPRFAGAIREAGVRRLNISLDSLKAGRYKAITRMGSLADALQGIRTAQAIGFSPIKINVVLMGGNNDDEIRDFVELTRTQELEIRFIELMPMGECACWDKGRFLPVSAVLNMVPELKSERIDGVAHLYRVPGWRGTVGLISPMSAHFCPSCIRIRITADGKLKPCLHSSAEFDLKGLTGRELEDAIRFAVASKPKRHALSPGHPSGSLRAMNEIGG